MRLHKIIIIVFLAFSTAFGAKQIGEIDKLLEQVAHENSPKKKQELLKQLKKKLAEHNKKAQEEADAIIKAKGKIPMQSYDENLFEK